MSFEFAYRPGMIRIVQIACIAVTAAVLYAVMKGVDGLQNFLGNTFDAGFIVGMLFACASYALICWVDPSSRPRGPAAEQKGFDDGIDKRRG